jgi:AraC-like DNA-binding protein
MQTWTWSHRATKTKRATVYPDGCCDVLIIQQPGQRPSVIQTALDLQPRQVLVMEGTVFTGYRMEPGARVSPAQLRAIAAGPDRAPEVLAETSPSSDIAALIAALGRQDSTVAQAAREQGLSIRSVQRLFRHHALPAPDVWRLLARARRAAAMLAGPLPLAAIAADCGFTDQPHLTRAFRHWFAMTPGQARQRPDILAIIGQPGL